MRGAQKVGDGGDVKQESFYNRTLLERQAIELQQNTLKEVNVLANHIDEGTPEWTLNLPETHF